MGSPYLGEIRMVSFGFAPKGWALCNGQTMPINQNQALFSLLGTMYGGDGRTTFLLPDFRGRTTLHVGSGFAQGQSGGEEAHILLPNEMPAHTHTAIASTGAASSDTPAANSWATGVSQYATTAITTAMDPTAIANTGSNQAHENRSPYLVVSFIIALTGVFPSRN